MLFEKNDFEKNLLSGFAVHTERIVKFSVRGPKNLIIEKSECFFLFIIEKLDFLVEVPPEREVL